MRYTTRTMITLTVALGLTMAGCTTMEPVQLPPSHKAARVIQEEIEPGDNVTLTTWDGEKHEFKVVELTEDAIVGDEERILFVDIDEVAVSRIDGEMTLAAGAAAGAATFVILNPGLVIAALFAAAMGSG